MGLILAVELGQSFSCYATWSRAWQVRLRLYCRQLRCRAAFTRSVALDLRRNDSPSPRERPAPQRLTILLFDLLQPIKLFLCLKRLLLLRQDHLVILLFQILQFLQTILSRSPTAISIQLRELVLCTQRIHRILRLPSWLRRFDITVLDPEVDAFLLQLLFLKCRKLRCDWELLLLWHLLLVDMPSSILIHLLLYPIFNLQELLHGP